MSAKAQATGPAGLSAQQVLDYARRASENGQDFGVGFCQRFVRTAYGSGGGAPTAVAAWNQAAFRHAGDAEPPPGVAVYWGGGAGHTAISAGGGLVYSTDVKRPGKIDLVSIDWINQHWGKQYLGWSEDNNGRRVTHFNAKPVDGAGAGSTASYAGGSSTTAGGGVATTQNTKMSEEDYGFAAAYYNSSPELKRLVSKAVAAQWTTDVFEARYKNTQFYKKHSSADRDWLALTTSDPAEADKRRADRKAEFVRMYRTAGVPVGSARLDDMVESSLKNAWSQAQMQAGIAAEFHYKPGKAYGGTAGSTLDDLRSRAAAYGVPLSDQTLQKWTGNVLADEAQSASFDDYLKTQAKSSFPSWADQIDSGLTVQQIADPYRQVMASTLEMSPEDITLNDPTLRKALQAQTTDGKLAQKPLWQLESELRNDPRYDKTKQARGVATDFSAKITQLFGAA